MQVIEINYIYTAIFNRIYMYKLLFKFLFPLFLCCFLVACHFPNPAVEPEYSVSKDSIHAAIRKHIPTGYFSIGGVIVKNQDSVLDSRILVQLLNVKKLPKNTDSLLALQKEVARIIKKGLKDPNQFVLYDLVFVQSDTTKKTLGTITKTTPVYHHEFNSSDL
jgi:hypothetical protein